MPYSCFSWDLIIYNVLIYYMSVVLLYYELINGTLSPNSSLLLVHKNFSGLILQILLQLWRANNYSTFTVFQEPYLLYHLISSKLPRTDHHVVLIATLYWQENKDKSFSWSYTNSRAIITAHPGYTDPKLGLLNPSL